MNKMILVCIALFLFTTSANLKIDRPEVKVKAVLNFDKELQEIRQELSEADKRNQKLEYATSDEKKLKKIKREIKKNK